MYDLSSKRETPHQMLKDLERIDEDAKARTYTGDWAQNLQHAAGFLTEATKTAQAALVGTSLKLMVQNNRFGSPSPIDILRPVLARFLGRHLTLFGGIRAVPKTGAQEDKDQADAIEKIGQAKWETEDLDTVAMEALNLSQACSHGYVCIEADDTLGEPEQFLDPETQQPMQIKRGDVIYRSHSPFTIALDPAAKRVEDSQWLIITDFLDKDEIQRRWPGIDMEGAQPAKYDQGRIDEMVGEIDKTRYIVKRLFLKKDITSRPAGEQYVFIGKGKPFEVKGKEIAMPSGQKMWISDENGQPWIGTYDLKYPLVDFRDEPLHIAYWGRGRQSSARPLLKAACCIWSRIVHIMSLPLILAYPEGTAINLSDIADVPFMKLEFNPAAGPPHFVQVTNLELYFAAVERCINMIDAVYSQHSVSKGEMPPSRTPASTVQSLQQQDVLADSPLGKMVLKAMTQLFTRLIGEGLRVWPDEYTVTVVGEDNLSKSYTLRKKALHLGVDVRVIPGDDNPKTRSAVVKELAQLAQFKVYEPRHIRRMLGNPIPEDMYDPTEHHREKIRQEEQAFERGEMVDIHKADNHQLHIEEHERRSIERWQLHPDPMRERENMMRDAHMVKHVTTMQQAMTPPMPMLPQGNTPPQAGGGPVLGDIL